MAISRMQNPRQLYNKGGIMNVSPRQQYGLGSFVKKAVKGVTGGIKKIAGSKLGKAALIGLGGYYLGGGSMLGGKSMFGGQGFSMGNLPGIGGLFAKGTGPNVNNSILSNFFKGEKTLGKTLGIGAGGSLLGTLFAKAGEGDQEAIGATRNVESLKSYLSNGYKDLGYSDEEIPALVEKNVSEYTSGQGGYAVGGRVGLKDGTDFENYLKGRKQFEKEQGKEQLYREYLEDMRRQKIAEQRSMVADGGRIGFNNGSEDYGKLIDAYERGIDVMPGESLTDYINRIRESEKRANGGRIGFKSGGNKTMEEKIAELEFLTNKLMTEEGIQDKAYASKLARDILGMENEGIDPDRLKFLNNESALFALPRDIRPEDEYYDTLKALEKRANGGRIGYAFGSDAIVDQASGIMNLPINQNKAGVKELDLRETGGFIPPVGVKEKADDIPAMLSNNEFVFTAKSVREMGDGDVNKGAQRMYDMMKKLEKGGRV
jgi:hypothetical protein